MEDKKTLWIILGISVCVLIVVAVGFFWFLPTDQSLTAAGNSEGTAVSGRTDFDPVEWVRQNDEYPGIEESEDNTEDFVVVSDELVYGLPEPESNGTVEDSADAADAATITLDIAEKEIKASTAAVTAAASVQKPAVQKPAAQTPVNRQPAEDVKKSVRVTEYWIQAGSFTSLSKAEDVKEALSAKGVVSTISTTKVNGTDFFRVRLGPYSDQMEADKFLSWIQAVKGFENSYISEVYVTKES